MESQIRWDPGIPDPLGFGFGDMATHDLVHELSL
jgi:hypothetical protein